MEIADYVFIAYIAVWCCCGIISFLASHRLKKLYPDIFEEYSGTHKATDISGQIKYIKFSLNPKHWKPIDDSSLIALLHASRILFFALLLMMVGLAAIL